jgi:hypothetical protein
MLKINNVLEGGGHNNLQLGSEKQNWRQNMGYEFER